jgi:hypothetical protein
MRLQPHDGDAGPVTGVSLSFDQKFLLTAAEDGERYMKKLIGCRNEIKPFTFLSPTIY